MGYSPPKCTCNGNQTHSSRYMILLECLHAQSHVSSPLTPSRMLKPNVRKIQFSKQKVFVLENITSSFGKYIGLPSEANCWVIFPKQSWVNLQDELLDNSPRQFFGKSSVEIPFTTIFLFIFFHVMHSHLSF